MKKTISIIWLSMITVLLGACGEQGLEGDWMLNEEETRAKLEASPLSESEIEYLVSMFNTQDLSIDSSGFTMKDEAGDEIECKFESASDTRATGACYDADGDVTIRGVWKIVANDETTALQWDISGGGETAGIVFQPVD